MKVEVTLHIEVPDEWTENYNLTTSKDIISMLDATGITEEITAGPTDLIVKAKVI